MSAMHLYRAAGPAAGLLMVPNKCQQVAVFCLSQIQPPSRCRSTDDTGINYCQQHRSLGGWGPPNDDRYWVLSLPNNGILIANNIFLNPTGTQVGSCIMP